MLLWWLLSCLFPLYPHCEASVEGGGTKLTLSSKCHVGRLLDNTFNLTKVEACADMVNQWYEDQVG